MKKREVTIHVAEVISANKNILTPLELSVKVLGMPGVAVVDREAELPKLIDLAGEVTVVEKTAFANGTQAYKEKVGKEGWVKELK